MPSMPPLADQISAIFVAPIPFVIALIFFGAVFWFVLEWRYRAVIDKMAELSDISRKEVDYWKDAAARSASQLAEQVEALKQKMPGEMEPMLDQMTDTTSRVNSSLIELGKANSAPFTSPGLWKPRATLPSQ